MRSTTFYTHDTMLGYKDQLVLLSTCSSSLAQTNKFNLTKLWVEEGFEVH